MLDSVSWWAIYNMFTVLYLTLITIVHLTYRTAGQSTIALSERGLIIITFFHE